MPSSRISVGVVFGGASGEHNVSIKSATTLVKALETGENQTRFEVIPIYIDLKGRWWPKSIAQKVLTTGVLFDEKDLPKPLPPKGFSSLPQGSDAIDVWFPALHGPNGEDGTVQGLFKLIGKPFIGSDVLGSAVGMDKIAMKAVFKAAELPQVPYLSTNIKELREENNLNKFLKIIQKDFKYPLFVKPANLGSSVGISKVWNTYELLDGLKEAGEYDYRIVIEQGLLAREFECAALGNLDVKVSEVGEVQFNSEWYDYETKYLKNTSKSIIPAPISKELKDDIHQLTLKAFKAVSARGLARVDFFYEERKHKLWINEINTLPGFTSQSMYPVLWEASGVTIEQLVAQLVDMARE